jgi:hypothetical protein
MRGDQAMNAGEAFDGQMRLAVHEERCRASSLLLDLVEVLEEDIKTNPRWLEVLVTLESAREALRREKAEFDAGAGVDKLREDLDEWLRS